MAVRAPVKMAMLLGHSVVSSSMSTTQSEGPGPDRAPDAGPANWAHWLRPAATSLDCRLTGHEMFPRLLDGLAFGASDFGLLRHWL